MTITEAWRSPVTTTAGERPRRAHLGTLGAEGDVSVGDQVRLLRGRGRSGAAAGA